MLALGMGGGGQQYSGAIIPGSVFKSDTWQCSRDHMQCQGFKLVSAGCKIFALTLCYLSSPH